MKKPILNFFLSFCFCIFISTIASAEVSKPLVSSGEATVTNITAEEAQELALKRARMEAVELVCGVRLEAETFVHNNAVQDDFIHSLSYGQIVSEEVLKWKAEVVQKSPTCPPVITYHVTIKTQVAIKREEPDPYYKVNVKLNKPLFQTGDEMNVFVKVTKPSYISVLNFAADGSVILLFPNQIRKDNYIQAGKEYQIPSPEDSKDILKLQVSTLPDHRVDTEHIKVIATREPLNLMDALQVQGQYGVSETTKFAAVEVARLIATIPPKSRAEATVTYKVVSSE